MLFWVLDQFTYVILYHSVVVLVLVIFRGFAHGQAEARRTGSPSSSTSVVKRGGVDVTGWSAAFRRGGLGVL